MGRRTKEMVFTQPTQLAEDKNKNFGVAGAVGRAVGDAAVAAGALRRAAVVSPIPRSEFSIWAAKRLELMNSLCVSILCLMNLSSSLLRLLRPLVFAATSTW